MKPPKAKRVPRVESRHGREFRDDYFWLRDRADPDVVAYLEAENAYTEAVTKPAEGLRETLYREILGRIKETDRSVPERFGGYEYFSRTAEGKQYAIHCRRRAGADAEESVILDENEMARDLEYFHLGSLRISPDHRLLAFAFDPDGSERYTVRFKDLATGLVLDDEIRDAYSSIEWAADNQSLFFNTIDEAHRPYRLYRHRLGEPPAQDRLVYQEDDEAFFLGLYKTKSRRFLMLHVDSNTTSEVRYLDAADPEGEFRVVQERRPHVEYTVEHRGDRFYVLTNEDAVNFKLLEVAIDEPASGPRKEVLPHRETVKLDAIQPFAGHLAVVEREDGLLGVRVIDPEDGRQHKIEFPEPVYTVGLHGNPEFETSLLRFTYTSLVTPASVFDYDMRTRERTLRKAEEVLGGYEAAAYRSERLYATSTDGVRVPISLAYRVDARREEGNPLLLYGYGSYGASVDPTFDSSRLSLLDRGFVFAIAHVRGGGEMGRPWYDAGKLMSKRNTFHDFIVCAEHLVAERYTTTDRMAILGGSAGGLLVGAVTNMRPDLFGAVVAKVPFVDVVNTMLDASIPLTVIEREEWGDPREQAFHDYMLSYSPCDNVQRRDYPPMLITTGLNDPRVAYWEPAKWTARLRALKTDENVLLLKTEMGTGHGGPSGRYDRLRERAFEYAFLLGTFGIFPSR